MRDAVQGDRMAAKPTLTVRIPADLKKAVAAAAKKDERSITSFVVRALRVALQGERRK